MSDRSGSRAPVERLVDVLGNRLDFSGGDRSFSPFYSDVGLGVNDEGGIACLYLHYNRRMTVFLEPFLAMPEPVEQHQNTAIGIQQRFREGEAQIAYCGHNTFIVDCAGLSALEFNPAVHEGFTERRCRQLEGGIAIIDGYLPTLDPRDHDETFPFVIGLRVIEGAMAALPTPDTVKVLADNESRIVLLFSVRMLEVGHDEIISRLRDGSTSAEEARQRTLTWWAGATGSFDIRAAADAEAAVLARAIYTLLANSAACPGLLQGRTSGFPSRGRYPCAYLWDSCFQSLGVAQFNAQLAEDSLLVFADNQRTDGKLHAFICSTWVHPGQSQPPLLGWAGHQIVRESGDKELAAGLLPALRRNTDWWLTQRMTRFGLPAAVNGMEVGWDNTPRFDQGAIIACDLNSYLLLQMRICADFARMGGDDATAAALSAQADAYAARMVDLLYDEESGLFLDVNVETGEPVRIKTPACFLPLLAGVPLAEDRKRRAIEESLLNSDHFFGAVPFPVVAYDEPSYAADQWWRGPTWINVAYLMIRVLDKLNYRDEAYAARERLYAILIADGDLREHFDSQTGAGLGAYEYGFTAAICLRLHAELREASSR